MQVISGPIGKDKAHYNAPSTIDPVLQAGLAHFWLVTIHPFDDGNGRIARAIADLALARSEGGAQHFHSMSAQIQQRPRRRLR
jgi:Fic family protein